MSFRGIQVKFGWFMVFCFLTGLPHTVHASENLRKLTAEEKGKLGKLIDVAEEALRKYGELDTLASDLFGTGDGHVPYPGNGGFSVKAMLKALRAFLKKDGVFTCPLPPDTFGRAGKTKSGRFFTLNTKLLEDLCSGNQSKAINAKISLIETLVNEYTHILQRPANNVGKRIQCDMERDSDLFSSLVDCALIDILTKPDADEPVETIDAVACPKLADCLSHLGLGATPSTLREMWNLLTRRKAKLGRRIDHLFTPEIDETGEGADNDWSKKYYGGTKRSSSDADKAAGGSRRYIDPLNTNAFVDLSPSPSSQYIREVTTRFENGLEVFHLLEQDDAGAQTMLRTFVDADRDGLPDIDPVSEVAGPVDLGPREEGDVQLHLFYPGDNDNNRTGIMLIDNPTGQIWVTPTDSFTIPSSPFGPVLVDSRITDPGGGFRFVAAVIPENPETGQAARVIMTSVTPVVATYDSSAIALDFFGPAPGEVVPVGTSTLGSLLADAPELGVSLSRLGMASVDTFLLVWDPVLPATLESIANLTTDNWSPVEVATDGEYEVDMQLADKRFYRFVVPD